MAFKANLKIGSKEFDVISCNYSLRRDVDAKGRPASGLYGGTINLALESSDDTSVIESMVNQYKPIDGTVTFKKSDEDSKMKEVSFEKGYIINFAESFDIIGSQPMLINFTVSAQKIKIGNAEHKNDWPGN
ncbi:type VI secretion system needle protein Hcp [Segetibacter sp. 3557_3]|uniref:type VI secretion system tube protein TssD n=1 Tax=Segetibacter sp. 3557_3 TaxID=2547429 RepID=UPI001058E5D3|nr:type VI secretion system tube protein TssD [Segetibacter sp. 3557_3]TDH26435.1 type VI secretion system needle protein Hcp [Segetibacter sp. 3557_3]